MGTKRKIKIAYKSFHLFIVCCGFLVLSSYTVTNTGSCCFFVSCCPQGLAVYYEHIQGSLLSQHPPDPRGPVWLFYSLTENIRCDDKRL